MSSEPTSSIESDNLRRSKRKKFKLDFVAAAHGNNQKKSRKDPHGQGDDDDDTFDDDLNHFEPLSVLTEQDVSMEMFEDDEEDTVSRRRTRRSTAHFQDYQEPDRWIENSGPHACHKCPSRYESKSSLANHTKMHLGEKRKFACELCDFSASTLKSLTHHNNIHQNFGVLSQQTSPVIPVASSADSTLNSSINSTGCQINAPPAPKLDEEAPIAVESVVVHHEDVAEFDTTPPPILEREDDGPPVLIREAPVRKSNRPMKPTQKAQKMTKQRERKSKTVESPKGSLPSSSASSVTPPPVRKDVEKPKIFVKTTKKNLKKTMKITKVRQRCPHCPFTTSTVTRLNRHSGGHKLKEGYICPSENCNFMCRKAGFLQKHYILHKGTLPWPPEYVKKGGAKMKRTFPESEEKKIEVTEKVQKMKKMHKRRANTVQVVAKAQLKSYIKVEVDDVIFKKCNIGECEFLTQTLTQLIVHKVKTHDTKTAFPQHRFLCLTCGHRAKSYAALRTHKLIEHTSTHKRFHRTYYLKECVGDKFFVKYNLSKVQEEVKEEPKEADGDESGDESFDSMCPASDVHPETLAAIEMKDVFFCCNMCPYKAPTMNRCQRHYDKHFTNDEFKCQYCSWSSRSKEVIVNHEKLHPTVVVANTNEAPVVKNEIEAKVEVLSKTVSSPVECTEESSLSKSIQLWCQREKLRHPELDEQFTRKMIDGVKGFQCTDCPYTSKYRGDMRSHKKRHDIEQLYRCVQCTYTTNRPVSLKDHLKQHAIVNMSIADIKSRRVVVNQGVKIGMRRGVGKDKIYCCDKCPYVTLALGCLWRHHRNHRDTAKINICSNCSYSSIDQRKMEEHTIIHLGLGLNEAVPFVKRVDQKGRPVSSLTDLNSEKMNERKSTKRKMLDKVEKMEVGEDEEDDEESVDKGTDDGDYKQRPEKKRKQSSEEPASDPELFGSSSQPTRQLSERATRNRINYSLLSKNGSGKPTPSTSSANLEKLAGSSGGASSESPEPDESVEVSHWKIRTFLRSEYGVKESLKCPDCPYKSSEPDVLEKHRYYHMTKTTPRPYACSDCTFNTYTPTALLQHLKLHSEGVYFDPMVKKHMKHRKGDSIPPGVKGYYCKNCSFKTSIHRNFIEHSAYHRQQLINRINITLKRQPPRIEYQRPKLKHQFVAKNAKYCKKCTFKCVSQSNFIEHLDRHGWNQLYKCYSCDYSDNTKSVVDFHQLNHHIVKDQTLHSICQSAKFRLENGVIQIPETEKSKPTPDEFVSKTRGLLKCPSCEYFCHVSSELAFHMSVHHLTEPNARETISYLHMGLVPPKATVTTV